MAEQLDIYGFPARARRLQKKSTGQATTYRFVRENDELNSTWAHNYMEAFASSTIFSIYMVLEMLAKAKA